MGGYLLILKTKKYWYKIYIKVLDFIIHTMKSNGNHHRRQVYRAWGYVLGCPQFSIGNEVFRGLRPRTFIMFYLLSTELIQRIVFKITTVFARAKLN